VSGGLSSTEARKVGVKGKESLADVIPRLGAVPLDFQPGSRWAYSASAGMDTLARIVEITSGCRSTSLRRRASSIRSA
jgi:hypothetical protein